MNPKVNWRVNDLIRNKETGHPFLVLHVSKYFCTVVDAEDNSQLPIPFVLLPRNFYRYALDRDMHLTDEAWDFNPIAL